MPLNISQLDQLAELECPNCGVVQTFQNPNSIEFCKDCGFPFICEYTAPEPPPVKDRLKVHRQILLWGFLLFGLFQILSSFYFSARASYEGYVVNLDSYITPEIDTGQMVLVGTAQQTKRVRQALAYIRRIDYQLFRDIVRRIPKITITERDDFVITNGAKLDIEHIGGFVNLPTGEVTIKRLIVMGTDPTQFYDRTLLNIVCVILHEYEHKRRFDMGENAKGAEEEIAAERFVYQFLLRSNAPQGLIDEKKRYLAQPYLPKYNRWYRFGEQH